MSSTTLDIQVDGGGFVSSVGNTVTGFFDSFGIIIALAIAIPLTLWVIRIIIDTIQNLDYMVQRRDHIEAERLMMSDDEYADFRMDAIMSARKKAVAGRRKEAYVSIEKGYMESIKGRRGI